MFSLKVIESQRTNWRRMEMYPESSPFQCSGWSFIRSKRHMKRTLCARLLVCWSVEKCRIKKESSTCCTNRSFRGAVPMIKRRKVYVACKNKFINQNLLDWVSKCKQSESKDGERFMSNLLMMV